MKMLLILTLTVFSVSVVGCSEDQPKADVLTEAQKAALKKAKSVNDSVLRAAEKAKEELDHH